MLLDLEQLSHPDITSIAECGARFIAGRATSNAVLRVLQEIAEKQRRAERPPFRKGQRVRLSAEGRKFWAANFPARTMTEATVAATPLSRSKVFVRPDGLRTPEPSAARFWEPVDPEGETK